MNIKVEKWLVDGSVSYKIIEIQKCCDKLVDSENISANNKLPENDESYDYENPEYSVKIVRVEEHCDSYDDYTYTEEYYEKINFCPFCGEPIVIEIVSEIDMTNEYKLLQEQRNLLWKQCCNTDSKKKAENLNEQVRELDNTINDMLTSDDFYNVEDK